MEYFNIVDIMEKTKILLGDNFQIKLGAGVWSNENMYPITQHLKTDSIWGFHNNDNKDRFAFSANFNFTNKAVKLYINHNLEQNLNLLQFHFKNWLDKHMDREPLLMFRQFTRGKYISCMLWSEMSPLAETYLNYLIKKERNPANKISRILYNKKYGDKELEKECQRHPKIECVNFEEILKNNLTTEKTLSLESKLAKQELIR